jgi:hypothetical protein
MVQKKTAGQTNSPKATGQQTMQEDSFQEVQRWKWCATDKTAETSKKAAVQTKTSPTPKEVIRNFFTPSGQWTWTPILPVPTPLQMRRQFLAKQLGHLQ